MQSSPAGHLSEMLLYAHNRSLNDFRVLITL